AGRNMRTCLKSAHRRRIARSLTSPDEHGSPRYKPRSGSCCVFPPTKGTPVQAILPDRDGFALSYGDSCDEFPRRWQTATLLERAATRCFRIARTVFRPTHVADAAISRPPAPVRVAADLGTVALRGSSAGALAAARRVRVPCAVSLGQSPVRGEV